MATDIALHMLLQPTTLGPESGSGPWTPQGVLALAIETSLTLPTPSCPLKSLAQGVGQWLYDNDRGDAATLPEQLAHMQAAANTTFRSAVDRCLHDQFTFSISVATSSTDVALFPMFPELRFTYTPMGTVDFGAPPVPDGYLATVAQYFNQLGGSDMSAVGDQATSFAGVVQTDYFVLLARQLTSDLVDVVNRQLASGGAEPTFAQALDGVDFGGLGGVLSRYLQHGMRLPDPAAPTTQEKGLYELTRQQFEFRKVTPASSDADPNPAPAWVTSVTMLPGAGAAGWITLVNPANDGASITDSLPVDLVDKLGVDVTPAWIRTGVGELDPLKPVPLTYTMINPASVTSDSTSISARPLPHGLQVQIRESTSPLCLDVYEGAATGTSTSNTNVPAAMTPFKAAAVLMVRIGLRQVQQPGKPPGTFYPNVYQLRGTDEETRELIESLLDSDPASLVVDFLIPQGASAYEVAGAADHVVLAKANLSTVAEPAMAMELRALAAAAPPVPSNFADLTDPEAFLRLVWECSVVHTGGFYLHCDNIPVAQFTTTAGGAGSATGPGEASLYVMVNTQPFGVLPDNRPAVSAHHNWVALEATTANKAVASGLDAKAANGTFTPVLVDHPNIPTGSTGFAATWPQAPSELPVLDKKSTPAQVSTFLEMLYHFLQYRITSMPGSTIALPSNWSRPAGAASIDQGATQAWYFRQTEPVHRLLGTDASPYAPVGEEVGFDVRLLDVFGNALPSALTQTITPTVVYNDPLFTLGQWVGVHGEYTVAAGTPDPTLVVSLTWTPDPNTSDPNSDRVQQTVRTYGLIAHQLQDPNTTMSVRTTLEEQPLTTTSDGRLLKDQMATYATSIRAALRSASPAPIQLQLVFDLTDSFDHIKGLPVDLFVVSVLLEIARAPASLDTSIIEAYPRVGKAHHQLAPDMTAPAQETTGTGKPTDSQSIGNRVFAEAFEAAYAGFDGAHGVLKVGTGPQPGTSTTPGDPAETGGSVNDQATWALRWSASNGVDVGFGNSAAPTIQQQPAYFAQPPLSTQLLTESFTVRDYDNPITDVDHRFTDIDLDSWMRGFTTAVHELFGPQMAPAIAALDGATYDTLIGAREDIAHSLSRMLQLVFVARDPTMKPSPVPAGDSKLAIETFRQALLTDLSNDYATSAVVQVPAQVAVAGAGESTVTGHDAAIPAQLFGKVSTNTTSDGSAAYAISPAFLPIPGGSSTGYPTFLIAAKHPRQQADLNLDLYYDIGFLEHDFVTLQGHYGYVPSSWVTFALPDSKTDPSATSPELRPPMGQVDIPIPLRIYPQSPTLFSQTASASVDEEKPLTTLQWDYAATVSNLRGVAQDELWLELTFNDLVNAPTDEPPSIDSVPVSTGDPKRPPPADLFEALARFTWEHPQISASLGTIPTQAYSATPDPGAAQALDRMSSLIAGVRSTLATWRDPAHGDARVATRADASNPNPGVPNFSWTYRLAPQKNSDDGSPTGNLVATRFPDDDALLPPWPALTGYTAPTVDTDRGVYTRQGDEPDHWSFTWNTLYVMTHQSARLSAWVERNDDLSEDPALVTNPAFVYKTPVVTFGSPVVPLIDVASSVGQQAGPSFQQGLGEVFAAFTRTDADQRTPAELKFEVEVAYEYVIAGHGKNKLTTRTPIFLVHRDVATASNTTGTPSEHLSGFVNDAAAHLETWYGVEKPPHTTDASVSLRLTVFATVSDGQLPLVMLADLQVPVGSGAGWWKTQS